MKFAIFPLLLTALFFGGFSSRASESASDCETAVETLRAGIEVHPDQAVVLFQDSLQTNPGCRRPLLITALVTLELDPGLLARLLYAARLEFPAEDSLFAEAALTLLPERAMDIRAAFLATEEEMVATLDGTALVETEKRSPSPESQKLDEEIRDAMARVAAKTVGKSWPEQSLSSEPVQFKKADEVRVPRQSRRADESSLANHLPIDRHDEREIAPGELSIDDTWKPSALRLDETKFASANREAITSPLDAKTRAMMPAGSVGLPVPFRLPTSSVYHIPAAAETYESTIDQESGESAPPALIIRPVGTSPSSPKSE